MTRLVKITAATLCAAWTMGCSSGSPPRNQLTASKSAVAAAEAVQNDKNPQAALYLKLAREGVQRSEELIDDEEYAEAERTLERAEADAELAQVMATSAAARAEAKQAMDDVDDLRTRM